MPAKLAVFAALLSACPTAPPSGSPIARAIMSAGAAWRATEGLPDSGDCLEHAFVRHYDTYSEFKAACHNPFSHTPDPRVLTGCTTWGFSAAPWRGSEYIIHIAPDNSHEYATIQHESLHVLVLCTNTYPNGDAMHTDPRIWLGDNATSVESRARAASH